MRMSSKMCLGDVQVDPTVAKCRRAFIGSVNVVMSSLILASCNNLALTALSMSLSSMSRICIPAKIRPQNSESGCSIHRMARSRVAVQDAFASPPRSA